jgi:hypothetical protein
LRQLEAVDRHPVGPLDGEPLQAGPLEPHDCAFLVPHVHARQSEAASHRCAAFRERRKRHGEIQIGGPADASGDRNVGLVRRELRLFRAHSQVGAEGIEADAPGELEVAAARRAHPDPHIEWTALRPSEGRHRCLDTGGSEVRGRRDCRVIPGQGAVPDDDLADLDTERRHRVGLRGVGGGWPCVGSTRTACEGRQRKASRPVALDEAIWSAHQDAPDHQAARPVDLEAAGFDALDADQLLTRVRHAELVDGDRPLHVRRDSGGERLVHSEVGLRQSPHLSCQR